MPIPSAGSSQANRSQANRLKSSQKPSRAMQRVHPLGIQESSPSLTAVHRDASRNGSGSLRKSIQRIPASFRSIFSSCRKAEALATHVSKGRFSFQELEHLEDREDFVDHRRCSWITKNSDEVYISFHDKCWGIPTFHDSQLFELLTLSGLLIDHSWTEILRRRELYREVFENFDHNVVAKMKVADILKICSMKKFKVDAIRIRCIVNNANRIQKVAAEFGSFCGYIWSHVNHRPIINKHRRHGQHSSRRQDIPLKTPKSEAISKDLVSRGFRLVSPVIVYSFMQAAGMAIDHESDCFRFSECVELAHKSWGLTSLGN